MDAVNQYNREIRTHFYQYLESPQLSHSPNRQLIVDKERARQWTDQSYNILTSHSNCRNNCRYCYMKRIRSNFFGADLEDLTMTIDSKKVNKGWMKAKKPKYIMFPSSHDIFEEFVDQYIVAARKILRAGHYLLIVTKPRLHCIQEIMNQFQNYKTQIMFRFTITSDNDSILTLWEPNAPLFAERLSCLQMAFQKGFQTSVSMEPFLSDPRPIIKVLESFVTDRIWVGTMSGQGFVKGILPEEFARVRAMYELPYLKELVLQLHNDPKIFWKAGVMADLAK